MTGYEKILEAFEDEYQKAKKDAVWAATPEMSCACGARIAAWQMAADIVRKYAGKSETAQEGERR